MVKNKYKSFRTFLFILSFLIIQSTFYVCNATIRYVSHEGSSTPPYTTWETAADSIMSAINISVSGDTIYVANGVYEEQIIMIPGLSLIGAGMDSTIIDTRQLVQPTDFFVVVIKDACIFMNFRIITSNNNLGTGCLADSGHIIIKFNKIEQSNTGIWALNSNTQIEKNIITKVNDGIKLLQLSSINYLPFIFDNHLSVNERGIQVSFGTNPTILSNSIYLQEDFAKGYSGSLSDTVKIYNNLIIAEDNLNHSVGIGNSNVPSLNINNYVSGDLESGISAGSENIVKNNVVEGAELGFFLGDNYILKYNNAWNNNTNYPSENIDSTNLSVDPMIVSEDSLDFHLQMYSPLIDAGDPNILDIDGSRSDIGLFGGPYGGRYTYRDLAPKPPSNLTAVYDSGFVLLRWNRNTEADFSHYRVYRDTVPNFVYDTTKIIAEVADTFYYDDLPEKYLATNYYYKLTAMDSTGHQSATSEEVHVTVTGVPEGPPIVVEEYKLLQNYPNPFNPSTIIPYRLIEPGYVKLYVYDIKGELVSVLVNQYQTAGYYEVEFRPNSGERAKGNLGLDWATGYNDDIASGIYIYQIMVKSDRNIPVFTDMNKMILLK
jgi:hypothetical protein